MNTTSTLIPDLSPYPDCEERRKIQNLGQKLEGLLAQYPQSDDEEIRKHHALVNETYWELNCALGSLLSKTFEREQAERHHSERQNRMTVSAWAASVSALVAVVGFFAMRLLPPPQDRELTNRVTALEQRLSAAQSATPAPKTIP